MSACIVVALGGGTDSGAVFSFDFVVLFFMGNECIAKKEKEQENKKNNLQQGAMLCLSSSKKAPVPVHLLVIWLADLKAKPVANQENAHPMRAWSCRICNQHRAHVTLRGTGFKPDTTRTNQARNTITGMRRIKPRVKLL
jgi:hypothetical protein